MQHPVLWAHGEPCRAPDPRAARGRRGTGQRASVATCRTRPAGSWRRSAVWWCRAAVAAVGTLLPGGRGGAAVRHGRRRDRRDRRRRARAPGRPPGRSDSTPMASLEGEPDPGEADWDAADLVLPAPDDLAVAHLHVGHDRPAEGDHAHPRRRRRDVATGGGRLRAHERLPRRIRRRRTWRPASSSTRSATWPATAASAFRMWIGRPTVIVPRFTVAGGARVARRASTWTRCSSRRR